MIYSWRCKIAEPSCEPDGVAKSQGLVAANDMHEALDRILEYMCLGDQGAVFSFYLEPWDTDVLDMDKAVLKAVEEDHIW